MQVGVRVEVRVGVPVWVWVGVRVEIGVGVRVEVECALMSCSGWFYACAVQYVMDCRRYGHGQDWGFE